MPEYLAPGVYVEETSFRAKSIEGVGTSTTAFVGPTRKGPFRDGDEAPETPELLTSYGDFERIYGGFGNLALGAGAPATNYLAHAVLGFFNKGGSRLYVSRVVGAGAAFAAAAVRGGTADEQVQFVARFPGAVGNGAVTVREQLAPASLATLATAPVGTLLRSGPAAALAHHVKVGTEWRPAANLASPPADPATLTGAEANPQILTLLTVATDESGEVVSVDNMGFDPTHPRWVGHAMAETPARRSDHLNNLFAIRIGANVTAIELRDGLFTGGAVNAQGEMERTWELTGGTDGGVPADDNYRLALLDIASLEDVSIVAAPGAAAYAGIAQAVNARLIAHASARRAYRIAVLDTPPEQTPGEARAVKSLMDSKYAALYYPWVIVPNPLARPGREDIPRELSLPPSGFVAGIYARNDVERGVYKAPANEVVRSAIRFEIDVNFGQQEMLNPLGVNCLRLLSGTRLPGVGRAARLLRSRVEVRLRSPLLQLPGVVHRPGHAVGRLRAERRAALGQRAPDDLRLPLQRVAQRRAARHDDRRGVLRALRSQHDDPERSGQRQAGVPDRRGDHQAGGVRDLPHRPEDGGRPGVKRG